MLNSGYENTIASVLRRLDAASPHADRIDPVLVCEMQQLADLHFVMMDYANAKILYWSILDAQLTKFGAHHRDSIETMIALSEVYEAENQHQVAEQFYKQALRMLDEAPEHHPQLRAKILFRLYGSYRNQQLEHASELPETRFPNFNYYKAQCENRPALAANAAK